MDPSEPVRCVQLTLPGWRSAASLGSCLQPRAQIHDAHENSEDLATMSQYFSDAGAYGHWDYNHGYFGPEPTPRPLERRRHGSRDERGEERPQPQRNYQPGNGAFDDQQAAEWENHQLVKRSNSQKPRQRARKAAENNPSIPEYDPYVPFPRVPSPPPLLSVMERPPLVRKYHSDNEAFGHPPVDEWEDDQRLPRTRISRDRSLHQVPSPPRVTVVTQRRRDRPSKKQAPSPPTAVSRPWPESHSEDDDDDDVRPLGPRRSKRAEWSESDSEDEEDTVPPLSSRHSKRAPSPGGVRLREDTQIFITTTSAPNGSKHKSVRNKANALGVRSSPPMPVTVISTVPESHPRQKKSNLKAQKSKRDTAMERAWLEGDLSSPETIELASRHRGPSPSAVNWRRHSDMDVSQKSYL